LSGREPSPGAARPPCPLEGQPAVDLDEQDRGGHRVHRLDESEVVPVDIDAQQVDVTREASLAAEVVDVGLGDLCLTQSAE
jgi:hypothetical protein